MLRHAFGITVLRRPVKVLKLASLLVLQQIKVLALMSDFSAKTFDYLIIGGGLAGLAVATRLSEDPSVSVGVLEAGGDTLIPDVLVPGEQYALSSISFTIAEALSGFLGKPIGNPAMDWSFVSTPLTFADGQSMYMARYVILSQSA